MESVAVLYLVGRIAPTSVPLDVAQFIRAPRIRLHTAAFYETHYSGESFGVAPTCMEAKSRYDISAVYRLYRYIRRLQPDVLHVHHTMPAFWGALLGKSYAQAQLVRSEHNDYESRSRGQRAIDTVSQGLADQVLCNSRSTYRSVGEMRKRILGAQWKVVHNGIDVQRIERASLHTPPFEERRERVTIGSVGRLVNEKNYSFLIRAFAQIVDQSEEEVELVLVGDGDNREIIESEIYRLGLGEHVLLTGEIDRDAVYAALHAFDLFVLPSLSEGFCNAAVEAMTAGLPIVCSDIRTLREIVGDVAIYADPERPESFTRAIGTLLKEGRDGWKRRGEKARSRAVEKYSIERTAGKYVESYLEVADGE
jgi:glycosyltransferase involved in cell wall biosynthesis